MAWAELTTSVTSFAKASLVKGSSKLLLTCSKCARRLVTRNRRANEQINRRQRSKEYERRLPS
eukprot:135018-Pyramimonas_sp.AAC.1